MKTPFNNLFLPLNAALIGSLIVSCAMAGNGYRLAHTFQAETPTMGDLFGTAVVFEGSVAAIKSNSGYRDPDLTSTTHIFEQTAGGWGEAATFDIEGFDLSTGRGNVFIGQELAISNGVVAIGFGSFDFSSSNGNIQFASRTANGWEVEFDNSNPQNRDLITRSRGLPGRSLDISDNLAIVADAGASLSMRGNLERQTLDGSARIYEQRADGSWRQVENLIPATPSERRSFVVDAVAIDGSTAVALDRQDGGIYFFERSTSGDWTETAKFLTPFDNTDDFFRSQVKINGDTTLVRDRDTDVMTILERDAAGDWSQTQQIVPETLALSFASVGFAIEGDLLAHTVAGQNGDSDRVELYRRMTSGTWSLLDTIHDPTTTSAADFGTSLAIDGGRLLVGASSRYAFQEDSPAGAAYLFVPVPEPASVALLTLASLYAYASRYPR